jgi:crossover junction endodeoxyribonuclease RuvC
MNRIIGLDMSLRSSGIAVIEASGAAMLTTVEYRLIKNPPARAVSACLLNIFRDVLAVLERCRPQAAAIEGVFFCKNVKTAVALGEARGAAIAACAMADVPLYEYSPRRVKQAVVGYGSAGKDQVKKMVMALLHLAEEPQSDAADALAIAICHAHAAKGWNMPNLKKL